MIRISIGNVGSGKTACEVREIFNNRNKFKTYSNIRTKIESQIDINPNMIVDGEGKNISLNIDYWKQINEPINIVLDEAHSIINSRRSMSKVNVIMTDWIALIRRVLGESDLRAGELVLITQLPNRVDLICREMATQIRYHVCHYTKTCIHCNYSFYENSEFPERLTSCPICDSIQLKKHHFRIEIKAYKNMEAYNHHIISGEDTHFKHYFVTGIEKFFPMYNTLQWDNMFSDLYY
jgi:hypothetical protein